jgi:V-type H+-transporting ATPase subunit C
VDPKIMIQDSEYLETHLVVLPNASKKDFLRSYETMSPMVVPRSAIEVTHDEEFTLFAATTFKKHSPEFIHKCREHKWTPRDYKYIEGGKEEEKKEVERVEKEERKLWGESLRLGRTGWSEAVMIWVHVLTLRVFVETVLRYGLPLEFVSALVKVVYIIPSFIRLKMLILFADYAQAGAEGKDISGLGVFISRWQRIWTGLER